MTDLRVAYRALDTFEGSNQGHLSSKGSMEELGSLVDQEQRESS